MNIISTFWLAALLGKAETDFPGFPPKKPDGWNVGFRPGAGVAPLKCGSERHSTSPSKSNHPINTTCSRIQ